MHPLSLSFRSLVATLLVGALHLGALPAWAADSPPKGEDIADLRAATDDAIKKLSLGINTAFDELIKARWWDREQADNTATALQQSLQSVRSELGKMLGPPMPREYEFLGTVRTGEHAISMGYLLRHEWSSYPAELAFIRLDGKWRFVNVNIGVNAWPFARRFTRLERPGNIRIDPVPNANLFKPADISDLKHACDTALTRIASGETSGFLAELMRDHFVSPGNLAEQMDASESAFRLAQPQVLANKGKLLPGKPEFLGISFIGTNFAALHYHLPYERGVESWRCELYKPARAWRLTTLLRNDLSVEEGRLLLEPRTAKEPVPEAERPFCKRRLKSETGSRM